MRKALFVFVFSLAALGLVGGSLILSQGGFVSSNKRATSSVFVPAPEAYVMAAIMFAMSILAVLWVLQQIKARRSTYIIGAVGYLGAVFMATRFLGSYLR